jgi:23S rRNA pseudouridine2605 synthase
MNDSTSDPQNMPHEAANSEGAVPAKKPAARKTPRKKAEPKAGAAGKVVVDDSAALAGAVDALDQPANAPADSESAVALPAPLTAPDVASEGVLAQPPSEDGTRELGARPQPRSHHAEGAGRGKRSPPAAAGGYQFEDVISGRFDADEVRA